MLVKSVKEKIIDKPLKELFQYFVSNDAFIPTIIYLLIVSDTNTVHDTAFNVQRFSSFVVTC